MSQAELASHVLTVQLLSLTLDILHLLFEKNILQDAVAGGFVHVQYFVSYDSFDAFLGQVVEHGPEGVFVDELILQTLRWVLVHIGPLPPQRKFFEQSWILLLYAAYFMPSLLVIDLIGLQLNDQTLQFASV